jgi:hypothetical protein
MSARHGLSPAPTPSNLAYGLRGDGLSNDIAEDHRLPILQFAIARRRRQR